ncbi:hypothetical protein M422DRAFT_268283 [Sphaerobolus stellatus SS14]|uniref:Uncharacterized protein n=1 Tax=Sphaerobolus stellatus (strain SS14) TaxID=990650 RepID=A0A0C9TKE7_SPHS4|nr:hypothetical protein M422DRAFT_268283 [Sphaerobolus stellatus SS14]
MAEPRQNDSYNQNNPPPNYELMYNMEYGLTMQIGDVGTSGFNLNSPYCHQAASPMNQGIPATAQPSSTWTSFTPGSLFHHIADAVFAAGSRQSSLPPAAQLPPSSQSPIAPPLHQSSLAGNPVIIGRVGNLLQAIQEYTSSDGPSKALSNRVLDKDFSDGPQDDVSDALDGDVSDVPMPCLTDSLTLMDIQSQTWVASWWKGRGGMATCMHPMPLVGITPLVAYLAVCLLYPQHWKQQEGRGKGSVPSSHPACPALTDLASPFNAEAADYIPECWEDYISIIKHLSFNFGWSQSIFDTDDVMRVAGINPSPPRALNVRNIFWWLYKKPVNNIDKWSLIPSSRSEESVWALTTNQAADAALVSMGFAEPKAIAAALQTVIKWEAHAAFMEKVKTMVATIGSIVKTFAPAMKTTIDFPTSQAEALKNLTTGKVEKSKRGVQAEAEDSNDELTDIENLNACDWSLPPSADVVVASDGAASDDGKQVASPMRIPHTRKGKKKAWFESPLKPGKDSAAPPPRTKPSCYPTMQVTTPLDTSANTVLNWWSAPPRYSEWADEQFCGVHPYSASEGGCADRVFFRSFWIDLHSLQPPCAVLKPKQYPEADQKIGTLGSFFYELAWWEFRFINVLYALQFRNSFADIITSWDKPFTTTESRMEMMVAMSWQDSKYHFGFVCIHQDNSFPTPPFMTWAPSYGGTSTSAPELAALRFDTILGTTHCNIPISSCLCLHHLGVLQNHFYAKWANENFVTRVYEGEVLAKSVLVRITEVKKVAHTAILPNDSEPSLASQEFCCSTRATFTLGPLPATNIAATHTVPPTTCAPAARATIPATHAPATRATTPTATRAPAATHANTAASGATPTTHATIPGSVSPRKNKPCVIGITAPPMELPEPSPKTARTPRVMDVAFAAHGRQLSTSATPDNDTATLAPGAAHWVNLVVHISNEVYDLSSKAVDLYHSVLDLPECLHSASVLVQQLRCLLEQYKENDWLFVGTVDDWLGIYLEMINMVVENGGIHPDSATRYPRVVHRPGSVKNLEHNVDDTEEESKRRRYCEVKKRNKSKWREETKLSVSWSWPTLKLGKKVEKDVGEYKTVNAAKKDFEVIKTKVEASWHSEKRAQLEADIRQKSNVLSAA